MIRHYSVWLVSLTLLLFVVPLRAQSTTIMIGDRVESALDAGDTQRWQITLLETTIVSISVEAMDDALDPMVTLLDPNGVAIISNDDYNYPLSNDALLQVFQIPRTGTYTIEISAFGDTQGSYQLTVSPGYDMLIFADDFSANDGWRQIEQDNADASIADGFLVGEVEGVGNTTNILLEDTPQSDQLYYESKFTNIESRNGWRIGLVFHYVSESSYYRLIINDEGFWQIERVNDEDVSIIQSWRTHPAIVPGAPNFVLGILISGESFDVLYNHQVVGTVYSSGFHYQGQVGLTGLTANMANSMVRFTVDNVQITTPQLVDNHLVLPQNVYATTYNNLIRALERYQIIPINGAIKLTAGQNTIENVQPGISRFSIGGDTRFTEFVLGATISWTVIGDGVAGCGFTFADTSPQNYTLAYVDNSGGYGVSIREGDSFGTGIYGESIDTSATSFSVVIIVVDGKLDYYINNRHVGSMDYDPIAGTISEAIVNFDAIDTDCTFDNIWLWSLDAETD